MMVDVLAPGLALDWLNGWLAAIGVTVLLPDVRLRWTDDPVPQAVFTTPAGGPSLAGRVAAALPSVDDLAGLTIAREREGFTTFPRTVSLEAFQARAELSRMSGDTSLSSTVTDLHAKLEMGDLPHAPFDPGGPGTVGSLWDRVVGCRQKLVANEDDLTAVLRGSAPRIEMYGLGFDPRRFTTGLSRGASVVPAVEFLAFISLALFPFRGNGRLTRQRGWSGDAMRRGSFKWFAWSSPLDRWAIDALLDVAHTSPGAAAMLGVTTWYESVPYRRTGDEKAIAYAGEPL